MSFSSPEQPAVRRVRTAGSSYDAAHRASASRDAHDGDADVPLTQFFEPRLGNSRLPGFFEAFAAGLVTGASLLALVEFAVGR